MNEIGRLLLVFGIILVVAGLLMILLPADKLSFLGRLPGDIVVKKKSFTVYFPIVTMILLSIVLTLILNLISRR
ncbi:MAG: DUF2905 domain-containing protein [Candidatus Krumholzibacteria bacterium]|nr:DUF2905 domain-containing protein [Candidatus Krumholzibacteria bacterium]